MATIGDLVIKVGGDPTGFKAAMSESSDAADKWTAKIQASVSQGALLFDAYGNTVQETAAKAAAGMEGLAAAEVESAASAELLGAAHGHAVSQIQATSGALRVLEGSGGIRAAERLLTMIPGLGSLLVAGFPIIGVIALTDAFEKMWAKYDPLTQATEKLKEKVQELDKSFADLGKRFESLKISEITEEFGRAAGAKLAAFYSGLSMAEDQDRIKAIAVQIQSLQAKLASGSNASPLPGLLGQFFTQRSEAAAVAQIDVLEKEMDNLQRKTLVDQTEQHVKQLEETKAFNTETAAAAREAASRMKENDEQALSEMKSHHALSVGDLIAYWQQRLATESSNAQRAREIQIQLGNLYQEQDKVIQHVADHGKAIQDQQAAAAQKQQAFLAQMVVESEVLALKIGADIVKANADMAKISAQSGAEAASNALAMQKLDIERQYGAQVFKTAQGQIDYQEQINALDKQEFDNKIRLAEQEVLVATDEKKRGDAEVNLQRVRDQANQREFSAQTRLQQMIQQSTALYKIQTGLLNTFHNSFSLLTNAISSALIGVRSWGDAFKSAVQDIGTQILNTLIGAALGELEKALLKTVLQFLGVKVAGSAMDVAAVGGSAAVGGAAAAAAAAPLFWWAPELAVAIGAAMAGSISGAFGPLAAFETGTAFVPNTGIAMIHQGERIIDAGSNKVIAAALSGGLRGGNSGGNTYVTIHSHSIAETSRALMKHAKRGGGMAFSPAS